MSKTWDMQLEGKPSALDIEVLDFCASLAKRGSSFNEIAFGIGYAAGVTRLSKATQYHCGLMIGAVYADQVLDKKKERKRAAKKGAQKK